MSALKLKSIRDKAPEVENISDILAVLYHHKHELMKDPTRCLTATGKCQNLIMFYESLLKGKALVH